MRVQSYFAVVITTLFLLGLSSCSSTNPTSASASAAGYHDGRYHLTPSEKGLTPEQLQLRIREEARICSDPSSSRLKKSAVGTAVKLGVGVTTGVGVDLEGGKKSSADMSRARMKAYNDRLVELGQPQLNLAEEIDSSVAERKM